MLKRGYFSVLHHVSGKHLCEYVQEFTMRYNIRQMDTIDQDGFPCRGAEGKTLSYAELIGPELTREPKML